MPMPRGAMIIGTPTGVYAFIKEGYELEHGITYDVWLVPRNEELTECEDLCLNVCIGACDPHVFDLNDALSRARKANDGAAYLAILNEQDRQHETLQERSI